MQLKLAKPQTGRLALVLTALCFSVLCGCAFTNEQWQFHRDLLDGDALVDDGHYDEAEAAYLALAPRAEREDLLRYIRLRLALVAELDGRTDVALERYATVYSNPASPWDQEAATALYRTGEIYLAQGDIGRWETTMRAVVQTFPSTYRADDAIADLVYRWERDGRYLEAIDWMTEVYPALRLTEMGDTLAYRTARIYDEHLDQCEVAIELYEIVADYYHRGGLVDDAIWRESVCYQRLGRIDDEYRILLDFIDIREISMVMADYDSEYYGPTLERLAQIHEERGELLEAIGVWRRYQKTFPLSLKVDDMQHHIIELQLQLGDREGALHSYRWLAAEYPDSRWVERDRVLLGLEESEP
jgi:tetratricopeptide (TPR) repeat protein